MEGALCFHYSCWKSEIKENAGNNSLQFIAENVDKSGLSTLRVNSQQCFIVVCPVFWNNSYLQVSTHSTIINNQNKKNLN